MLFQVGDCEQLIRWRCCIRRQMPISV